VYLFHVIQPSRFSFSLFIDLKINTENIPFHLKFTNLTTVFNTKHKNVWLGEIDLKSRPLIVNTSFLIDIYINGNGGYNVTILN
jgi:hypothetical protein